DVHRHVDMPLDEPFQKMGSGYYPGAVLDDLFPYRTDQHVCKSEPVRVIARDVGTVNCGCIGQPRALVQKPGGKAAWYRKMGMVQVETFGLVQFKRFAIGWPDVGHQFGGRCIVPVSPDASHTMHIDTVHYLAGGKVRHSGRYDVDSVSAGHQRRGKWMRYVRAAAADRRIFVSHAQYFH